jgi:hypothetical protein
VGEVTMLWGSIKAVGFVGLAMATGVVVSTVPVGGKTIAARLSEVSAPQPLKHAAAEATARVKHEVEEEAPTPTPAAPKPGKIDPHAVATVIPDAPTGDNIRPTERQAINHIIQQKASARPAKAPKRP